MTKETKLTELQVHMRGIAKKGGLATKKKYGNKHFSNIVNLRWAKKNQKKGKKVQVTPQKPVALSLRLRKR